VNRTLRLLLLVVVLITLTATAGALALGGEGEAADPEDANNPERVVGLLDNAGIATDASALTGLAETYGMGGAVRILAFADAAGVDPAEVTALRDAGMGWRQVARELGIDLGPGIGWIMSGNGQADKDKGPGPGNGWGPGGNPNKPDEPEGE
jgi:hypothetical protein